MFQSIWEDVKQQFAQGNMVTRIIIVNVAVFVLVNLIWIIGRISHAWETPEWYSTLLQFFMMPSYWKTLLFQPWSIITSMFLHEGFWHILWNMLFLYWFGRIVGDFIGDQRILPIYLLGGLFGNVIFFLTVLAFPAAYGGATAVYALGASAGVMAVVVAAGAIAPNYIIRLLFLGDVRLKYIVAILVFIDLIGMAGRYNTGGHFAHLGGAFFGLLFIAQLRQGNDFSKPVNRLLDSIGRFFQALFSGQSMRRPGPKVAYRNPTRNRSASRRSGGGPSSDKLPRDHQEQLDAILDKIKESGYDSLSKEEKEFLFNASKQ
jgi:membrane associated rhomboid family serine protease